MRAKVDSAAAITRFDVLGLPVSAIDMGQALDTIDTWIRERTSQYVCITGVHGAA